MTRDVSCLNCKLIEMGSMACYQVRSSKITPCFPIAFLNRNHLLPRRNFAHSADDRLQTDKMRTMRRIKKTTTTTTLMAFLDREDPPRPRARQQMWKGVLKRKKRARLKNANILAFVSKCGKLQIFRSLIAGARIRNFIFFDKISTFPGELIEWYVLTE